MTEIPDDVMKAARDAVNSAIDDRGAIGVIARAILAERERCAKVAEEDLRSPMAKKAGHVPSWLARGRVIAAAIRKGTTT